MQKYDSDSYRCDVIGRVHSPFKEKFGIPRQSGLISDIEGEIELLPPWNTPGMVDRLEEYSHLWVSFIFHECLDQGWRERVRPPRLGGNERVGVYASRSPFRPNHLGLSVVRLLNISVESGVRLSIAGLDMLDGTPVVDIKPYVPYVDCVPGASGGFAPSRPELKLQVVFTDVLKTYLDQRDDDGKLERMIIAVLTLDPRPAYHQQSVQAGRLYGMRLADVNFRWKVDDGQAIVESIEVI